MAESPRRHTIDNLTDRDVGAIERSIRTRHRVLGLTDEMRSTEQVKMEADLLAHVGALVQEHMRGKCACMPAPVPEPQPVPIPLQHRRT